MRSTSLFWWRMLKTRSLIAMLMMAVVNYQPPPLNSLTQSSMFRCADCDFNVHLLCGPLPCTIKYEHHIHLILVDIIIENDSGKYYCDICESERDPRICVYYYQELKFIAYAHIYALRYIFSLFFFMFSVLYLQGMHILSETTDCRVCAIFFMMFISFIII